LDNFDESIEFIKLKDLEDVLSEEDTQYISKEVYDFLLEQYKRLDSEFLSKLRGLDSTGELDTAIDQYLDSPSSIAQKELINFLKEAISIDGDLLSKISEKFNLAELNPEQQINTIINIVN